MNIHLRNFSINLEKCLRMEAGHLCRPRTSMVSHSLEMKPQYEQSSPHNWLCLAVYLLVL